MNVTPGPGNGWRQPLSRVRAACEGFARQWPLATFSLATAFAVWIVVQDVDNPRVEGTAPQTGGIEVRAINVRDGSIVENIEPVRVRVEARESDIATLRADDFRAEVDASQLSPDDLSPSTLRVRVISRKSGVDVIEVTPAEVSVRALREVQREIAVCPRILRQPSAGFALEGEPCDVQSSPGTVTIRGREELVAQVESVTYDVNLAAARGGSFEFEGDLVARTAAGNEVRVSISEQRARGSFVIVQSFAQRRLSIRAEVTGATPGYTVAVEVRPSSVLVTGPKATIDGLPDALNAEPYDVTGQKQSTTVVRNIELPPNISADPQTVTLEVRIEAIDQVATLIVPLTFVGVPAGFAIAPGNYTVQVQVSGPNALALRPADFRAVIQLAGASAGAAEYTATITAPPEVKVGRIEPVTLTLVPIGPGFGQ